MNPLKKHLLNFGIINIDKPAGPTSYAVSSFVKKALGLSKASHMGTLDPKVTGVLPITLGRACKLAAHFIRHDKEYVGILHTHTVQEMKVLQQIIDEHFLGTIKQTPPHRSAVKRAERERRVYTFKLLEGNGRNFLFKASVEGGTYIRKLCSDLGEHIGGAHMGELRRTRAGIFSEEKLITLQEFEEALANYKKGNAEKLESMIMPAEVALKQIMPIVSIDKGSLKGILHGKPLLKNDIEKGPLLKKGQVFAAFNRDNFIGVYEYVGNKTLFAKPLFVYTND